MNEILDSCKLITCINDYCPLVHKMLFLFVTMYLNILEFLRTIENYLLFRLRYMYAIHVSNNDCISFLTFYEFYF